MELKDLEEMFRMEQELDIPHKDRWYKQDFDKRELEAEQPVKNCNIPCVSKNGKLHTCQYCGAETTQPDEVCYAAPKPVAVCENCRFNKPKNYHDQMWCRDCKQKNHFEQTVC